MSPLIRRSFPFSRLRRGQRAVQVGTAAWTLDAGICQTIMMATIVGPTGHVLAIEPDKNNVDALTDYVRRHNIKNVSVLQRGIWNTRCTKRLVVSRKSSGAHLLVDALKRKQSSSEPRGNLTTNTGRVEIAIECDTLDNLLTETGYEADYINITVNGAEYEVLQGMHELLSRNISVTFPIFGPRSWFPDAFKLLEKNDFSIVVSDAPPTVRGPAGHKKDRRYRWPKSLPQRLVALASKSSSKAACQPGFDAELAIKRSRIEVIPID